VCLCVTVIGNSSAAQSGESIRYYHVISVGVICFLIGAIASFVILIHCQPRISNYSLHHGHKHHQTDEAAAAEVSLATAEKRRDVTVTSRGGGVTTLDTVIGDQRSSIDGKICRTSDVHVANDVFSAGRCNGSSHKALVHLRQYYRRHYTDGVADTNYNRT